MKDTNGILIYQRIKELCDKRKINIKELSEKAGFRSPSTIYNYKYGKVVPNKTSLNAIAAALHTTTDYLEGKTDNYEIPQKNNDGEKFVTMFRKKSEGLTPDEKKEFEASLNTMMDYTKAMIMERRNRHNEH